MLKFCLLLLQCNVLDNCVHNGGEDILLTAYDLDSSFVGICIELLGELVAAVIIEIGRVDIEDKLAVVGGI